jgi:hypothetical protein
MFGIDQSQINRILSGKSTPKPKWHVPFLPSGPTFIQQIEALWLTDKEEQYYCSRCAKGIRQVRHRSRGRVGQTEAKENENMSPLALGYLLVSHDCQTILTVWSHYPS